MSQEGALMPQIRILFQVDQLDRAIARVASEREEIRQQVKGAKAETEALQQELTASEAQLAELETSQRQREEELKRAETKLSRLASSSHITTEAQFEAARREQENLRVTRGELEEAILAGFEEHERLTALVADLKQRLEARKRLYAEQHTTWRSRFDTLGEELEVHRRDRLEVLPQMPLELREQYDRLMARYKDRAAVTVSGNRCLQCHVGIPAQHVIEVLMGKALHTCDSCKRLILPAEGL